MRVQSHEVKNYDFVTGNPVMGPEYSLSCDLNANHCRLNITFASPRRYSEVIKSLAADEGIVHAWKKSPPIILNFQKLVTLKTLLDTGSMVTKVITHIII